MGTADRVLYVSPNGIGTALVRSQVLPYVRGLSERGFDIRLMTFERGVPYPEGEFPRDRWLGLRPRQGSGLVAKLLDIAGGILAALRVVRRDRVRLVHARSYLPGAIAWAVSRLTGAPFVFDMRGFLGDEYVEAGLWNAGDVRYRGLRVAERALLRGATEIVVLTEAAARRLRTEPRYRPLVGDKRVSVIPCAVDLERFHPHHVRAAAPTLVYSGSLGMWYLLDEMLRVYAYAREMVPGLRLRVLNRDERTIVHDALVRAGLEGAPVEVRGASYDEMPGLLAEAHAAIALLKQVSSKSGSSPIKVAEYLACGLPVIVNEGLGDTDELVRRYGAGHVVRAYDDDDLRGAARALVRLLDDERARENARRLAEEVFDVRRGVDLYASIYGRAIRGSRAAH